MKQVSTCLLFLLLSYAGFAQVNVSKKDVPPAVVHSYLSQNSKGASDSMWTKETITIYKVHYLDNGQRFESHYFSDGSWIKTITEVGLVALPATVTNQVKEMYPNYKIDKAYIELNSDGKFYSPDLSNNNNKMTVYYTMSGKFFK